MIAWRSIGDTPLEYMSILGQAMDRAQERCPEILRPVRQGVQVIASDYSGQHRGAAHEVYTFVVTTLEAVERWAALRTEFRARWLPDGRRLSFKQLGEPMRRRALPGFLAAAGALTGNLITVLVGSSVGTFIDGGPAALVEVLPDCFEPGTPLGTVEKMFRLASLVALVQAALREESQRSHWISDHDETLATFERREDFGRLATYLTFGLTGWKAAADQFFYTTHSARLPEWAEDLTAIADIAAGAYAKLAKALPAFVGRPSWTVEMSSDSVADPRARLVGDWLAHGTGELRHVLMRLERDSEGQVRASAQSFLRQS